MNYHTLKNYLEKQPLARERRNKNRAVGNLLIEKYHLDIPKDKMADIVGDAISMDRMWRLVLEREIALRGNDYKEKEKVEQEYEMSLGYEPRYFENLKILKKL